MLDAQVAQPRILVASDASADRVTNRSCEQNHLEIASKQAD